VERFGLERGAVFGTWRASGLVREPQRTRVALVGRGSLDRIPARLVEASDPPCMDQCPGARRSYRRPARSEWNTRDAAGAPRAGGYPGRGAAGCVRLAESCPSAPASGTLARTRLGTVVAGTAAGFINDAVAREWGEVAAVVVSAPVGEEILKGLGVLMAVRRREIANRIHGAVIAFWVAAGFTLTEELVYLSFAVEEGNVAATFVERGILGSFVHPLATVWIGLAVGGAIEGAHRVGPRFLAGLVPSIALHAAWNSASVLASDEAAGIIYPVFLVILAATIGLLVSQRRRYADEHERTAAAIRRAALGVGVSRHEVDVLGPFLSSGSARAFRQGLPREHRASFDTAHAAIARAFAEARRRGTITPAQIGQMRDFARATTALR
jgi:RsiW-degrading membrane proteinase PrsW (M82 family)